VFKYSIGNLSNRVDGVCRLCFCHAYRIKKSALSRLTSDIKVSKFKREPSFSDRSAIASGSTRSEISECLKMLDDVAIVHNFELRPDEAAMGVIRNSPKAFRLYAWMQDYFVKYGDFQPNRPDEIHIDNIDIPSLLGLYLKDMENKLDPDDLPTIDDVTRIWIACFP